MTDTEPTAHWLADRLDEIPEKFHPMIRQVCRDYGIGLPALFSRRRPSELAVPRQILMTILYWHGGIVLTEIGNWFRRDHGTVIHARKKVERNMSISETFRAYVEHLEKEYFGIDPSEASEKRQEAKKARLGPTLPREWQRPDPPIEVSTEEENPSTTEAS